MIQESAARIAPPLNRDAGLIKLVAMVTMLIDHMGAIFFPDVPEMRIIGRIAFPLYCFGIVMGFAHTRSWPKYALRLFIGALVAQPCFMLALNHQLLELNVMFTLLLGLLSIVGMREKRWFSHIWAPLACLVIASIQQMDYGWRGVLLIQLMYLAQASRGGFAALMTAFCLYWGSGSQQVSQFFGLAISAQAAAGRVFSLAFSFIRLQGLALLSLPFMIIPTNSGIRIPKWLSYSFYPAHLLILGLLRTL
jgi:hypothetical protein